MSAPQVTHGSKNVHTRKRKREQHTCRQKEGLRGIGGGGGGAKSGRCVGSDPYWPHQALAGRCTPRSGRRSQTAAEHRPRSAAYRASPQTASCLLDRKRERGRKREEGGWRRGENRERLQLMAPFCRAERNLCDSNPTPPFSFYQQSAAAVVIVVVVVVDLTVMWCATPPWYEGDIYSCIQ